MLILVCTYYLDSELNKKFPVKEIFELARMWQHQGMTIKLLVVTKVSWLLVYNKT